MKCKPITKYVVQAQGKELGLKHRISPIVVILEGGTATVNHVVFLLSPAHHAREPCNVSLNRLEETIGEEVRQQQQMKRGCYVMLGTLNPLDTCQRKQRAERGTHRDNAKLVLMGGRRKLVDRLSL